MLLNKKYAMAIMRLLSYLIYRYHIDGKQKRYPKAKCALNLKICGLSITHAVTVIILHQLGI